MSISVILPGFEFMDRFLRKHRKKIAAAAETMALLVIVRLSSAPERFCAGGPNAVTWRQITENTP
jgi:hypothetical protein